MIKSWDFGASSITELMVSEMLKESYFPTARVKVPPTGQTVPVPEEAMRWCSRISSPAASAYPTFPSSAAFWRRSMSNSTT